MSTRRRSNFAFLILTAATLACRGRPGQPPATAQAQTSGGGGAAAGADCRPLETREPNASGQRPAFREQTRGCGVKSDVAFDVAVLARGLDRPWAVEPLPGGDLLVTEKPGRLRIVTAAGRLGQPLAGVPEVDARGQGGLLDVALSPAFERDRTIYWSFSEPRQGGNATSVARGVLSEDRARLEQVKVILQAMPTYDGDKHYGSRLAFGPDGMLYVTLGDRSDKPMRPQAQRLDSDMGKILRVNPTAASRRQSLREPGGRAAGDWSVGHRNVRRPPSIPRGGSGWWSTAPRAATSSTSSWPERTTAGRWWPTARSTPGPRSRTPSPRAPGSSSRCTTGTR
jgi:glucose/arabinose dehydrogenase